MTTSDKFNCFSCGAEIVSGSICNDCGYDFSFELGCPRIILNTSTCVHTRRACIEKDYHNCKIFNNNQE